MQPAPLAAHVCISEDKRPWWQTGELLFSTVYSLSEWHVQVARRFWAFLPAPLPSPSVPELFSIFRSSFYLNLHLVQRWSPLVLHDFSHLRLERPRPAPFTWTWAGWESTGTAGPAKVYDSIQRSYSQENYMFAPYSKLWRLSIKCFSPAMVLYVSFPFFCSGRKRYTCIPISTCPMYVQILLFLSKSQGLSQGAVTVTKEKPKKP